MNLNFLIRSLLYYWRTNLAVLLGVVAGTAVIGGALIGALLPRRALACLLGAWAGQVVALLFLPGHDRGWFLLGLISTGVGSTLVAAGAAIGSWLRELLGSVTGR